MSSAIIRSQVNPRPIVASPTALTRAFFPGFLWFFETLHRLCKMIDDYQPGAKMDDQTMVVIEMI